MVELQKLQHSTFPATSSHSTGFFWLFQAGRSKCKGTWPLPCRIKLAHPLFASAPVPLTATLRACPLHAPPRRALVTSQAFASLCTPAAACATSPSPCHHTHRIAMHLTATRATSPCLSQPPAPPTLPSSSQMPTPPTLSRPPPQHNHRPPQ
jgi:hypothetical protein